MSIDPRIGNPRILVEALQKIDALHYLDSVQDAKNIATIALARFSGEADKALDAILDELDAANPKPWQPPWRR